MVRATSKSPAKSRPSTSPARRKREKSEATNEVWLPNKSAPKKSSASASAAKGAKIDDIMSKLTAAAKPKLVLPPQYSIRILRISTLTLASIGAAVYNELPLNVCLATTVFLTSVNYWRNPTFGWRRNLDIVCAVGSLSFQAVFTAYDAALAARHAYWTAVASGGCCYLVGLYCGRVLKNFNLSSALHCGVHVCGNVGNLILYDSLGANHVGFGSPR